MSFNTWNYYPMNYHLVKCLPMNYLKINLTRWILTLRFISQHGVEEEAFGGWVVVDD